MRSWNRAPSDPPPFKTTHLVEGAQLKTLCCVFTLHTNPRHSAALATFVQALSLSSSSLNIETRARRGSANRAAGGDKWTRRLCRADGWPKQKQCRQGWRIGLDENMQYSAPVNGGGCGSPSPMTAFTMSNVSSDPLCVASTPRPRRWPVGAPVPLVFDEWRRALAVLLWARMVFSRPPPLFECQQAPIVWGGRTVSPEWFGSADIKVSFGSPWTASGSWLNLAKWSPSLSFFFPAEIRRRARPLMCTAGKALDAFAVFDRSVAPFEGEGLTDLATRNDCISKVNVFCERNRLCVGSSRFSPWLYGPRWGPVCPSVCPSVCLFMPALPPSKPSLCLSTCPSICPSPSNYHIWLSSAEPSCFEGAAVITVAALCESVHFPGTSFHPHSLMTSSLSLNLTH